MSIDFDQLHKGNDVNEEEIIVNLKRDVEITEQKKEEEKPVLLTGPMASIVGKALDQIYALKQESMQHVLKAFSIVDADKTKESEQYVYVTSNKLLRDSANLTTDFDAVNNLSSQIDSVVILTEPTERLQDNTSIFDEYVRSKGIKVNYSYDSILEKLRLPVIY